MAHSPTAALPVPLTFPGVVAFSRRQASWFLLGWITLAGLAAGTTIWFFHYHWIPVVEESIETFPANLKIQDGRLNHLPPDSVTRHQNNFLSLVVSSIASPTGNMTSDFQIILTPEEIRLKSLLGYLALPYPRQQSLNLSADHVIPWWNARKGLFTIATFFLITGGLLIMWTGLATCYYVPLSVASFFADRRTEFWPTWRLAGSILVPGVIIMTISILLYGLHLLSLLGLLLSACLHLIIGWVYLAGAIRHIPRVPESAMISKNPFSGQNLTL